MILFTGRSYEEVTCEELALNDSDWNPSKDLINFASTMVKIAPGARVQRVPLAGVS